MNSTNFKETVTIPLAPQWGWHFLDLSKISHIMHGLPWNFVHVFKIPRRWILMILAISWTNYIAPLASQTYSTKYQHLQDRLWESFVWMSVVQGGASHDFGDPKTSPLVPQWGWLFMGVLAAIEWIAITFGTDICYVKRFIKGLHPVKCLIIQYFGIWPPFWKKYDIPISLSSTSCMF